MLTVSGGGPISVPHYRVFTVYTRGDREHLGAHASPAVTSHRPAAASATTPAR